MKNKLKKIVEGLLILLFWLIVWEIFARKIKLNFVLPTVGETFDAIIGIFSQKDTIYTIILSLVRISAGFLTGVILALGLGILAVRFELIRKLLSPLNIVAKSTPVAVIIIMLWLMIGGARVPMAVSAIMVLPIIWQSILDGYEAIDHQLDEVCTLYKFSFAKKLRLLVMPTLLSYLLPALITASGLAFKAGIAAEIICMTKKSIGQNLYNAKYMLEGPMMFGWTVIVLILSYLLERLIKLIIGGIKKKCRLN